MKFLYALSSLLAVAAALEVSTKSQAGQNILSHARLLNNNNNNNKNNNNAVDYTWVSGYSLKFQGCHNIKQWNDNANGDEDVRIATKSLVRFRLCPSTQCTSNKAAGCSSGYGDYVVDMDTFMTSYYETKMNTLYDTCSKYLSNSCSCVDDGTKGDDFNVDTCTYDCYYKAGMNECIDKNPYADDQGKVEEFDLETYMQCTKLNVKNYNNGNRNLGNNNNNNNNNNNVQYYVGPYCGQQGGGVFLGLFSDDTCTTAETATTFKTLTGIDLPYGNTSVITTDCLTCVENKDANANNQNDQNDADNVLESCTTVYEAAGKCEAKLASGVVTTPNNNACNYMEGIKIVGQDGIINSSKSRPSAVATAFSVIFAMAFCATAFYVWYLRTRLGVKRNALL